MGTTEKVVVRLTHDTVAVLETLIRSGDYSSISDIVMTALREFIDSNFTAEDINHILEDYLKVKKIDPEVLIADSDKTDMEEAIRIAVSEYVHDKIEQRRICCRLYCSVVEAEAAISFPICAMGCSSRP